MARAKRTDRTVARRRHRAELAAVDGTEPDADVEETAEEAGPARSAATAPAKPGSIQPGQRPSITAAFKAAYRPAHLREDLRALPQILTNWGFLAALGLTVVAGAWFVLAYDSAMAAIPVGTATDEQMATVVGTNSIAYFVGQMAFLSPPPAIGAFMIGFAAKRASYLGGLIYGILVLVILAGLISTSAGRLLFTDKPDFAQVVLLNHAAFSPVGAALFAAAAAWYRRFLQLSNPNQRQAQPPRRPQGRGDMKPRRL